MTMSMPIPDPAAAATAPPQHDGQQRQASWPSDPQSIVLHLRATRNSVIGSRTRKSSLVNNGDINYYVNLLYTDLVSDPIASEIVALSATIIASLSNTPPQSTLLQLLRAGAQNALLHSLKRIHSYLRHTSTNLLSNASATTNTATTNTTDPLKLLESVLRALRSLLLAIADHLSSSPRWGIGSSWGTTLSSGGVSIPAPSQTSGGIKVIGQSSRERNQRTATHPGSSDNSMDIDGLSSHAKPTQATPAAQTKASHSSVDLDEESELRLLSRSFITIIFTSENLPYLIGPLFICGIPQQQPGSVPGGHQVYTRQGRQGLADASSEAYSRSPSIGHSAPPGAVADPDFEMMLAATTSVARDGRPDVDPMAMSISASEDGFALPKPGCPSMMATIDSLPLSVRARILSIVEMVCAILAGTLYVPGLAPAGRGGGSTESGEQRPESPQEELQWRRNRVLDFRAEYSPFNVCQDPSSSISRQGVDEESRGRRDGAGFDAGSRDEGAQASVIRRGSRSRARLSENKVGYSDDYQLPLWEENGDASPDGVGILSVLLSASECGYIKAQEASLWCLAELTRENASASIRLFRCTTPSGTLPTTMLLGLRKSTSVSVKLAAFCCLSHIIKVHRFTPKTNQCVLEVLLELMDAPNVAAASSVAGQRLPIQSQAQSQAQSQIQAQAAFAVARLVAGDSELQTLAAEQYGALGKLCSLLEKACSAASRQQLKPPSSVAGVGKLGFPAVSPVGGLGSNPAGATNLFSAPSTTIDESSIRLREACLTALAAITCQRDDLRRKLVDNCQPPVLTLVVPCLTFPALGVRVGACRLVRALSRSISILRTSLVDAGVAQKLLAILKDEQEEEEVKMEATAVICNLVLKFSPMKKLLVDEGGIDVLVKLARGEGDVRNKDYVEADGSRPPRISGQMRLNSLWAIKNLIYACESSVKAEVMERLTWPALLALAYDRDIAIQEQALNVIRNLASSTEADIEMTIRGFGGVEKLFDVIEEVCWSRKDVEKHAPVIEQAAYIIVNIATGSVHHRRSVIRRPNILDAISYFMTHPRNKIRVAGVWAIINLTYQRPLNGPHGAESSPSSNTNGGSSSSGGHAPGGGAGGGRDMSGSTSSSAGTNHPQSTLSSSNIESASKVSYTTAASTAAASPNDSVIYQSTTATTLDLDIDIASEATMRLRAFGVPERLKILAEDDHLDVRDKAKCALARFEANVSTF